MLKNVTFFGLVVSILAMVPVAHAGKVELTTYYPSPTGEYNELKSNKLAVGTNASTPNTNGVMNFGGISPASGTDPASANDGDLYYNTQTAGSHKFRYFDSSSGTSGDWKNLGGGSFSSCSLQTVQGWKDSSGNSVSLTVTCPAGTHMTSGGYDVSYASVTFGTITPNVWLPCSSHPRTTAPDSTTSSNSWLVSCPAGTPASPGDRYYVDATAICCS